MTQDIEEELIPKDIVRQIKECADACQLYRSALFGFLTVLNVDNWESTKKEFSSCKLKCHRCSLIDADMAMRSIDLFSPKFDEGCRPHILFKQNTIIPSVSECIDKWNESAIFGCDRNPVETYTSACVLPS